jgi:hypothetical protein
MSHYGLMFVKCFLCAQIYTLFTELKKVVSYERQKNTQGLFGAKFRGHQVEMC